MSAALTPAISYAWRAAAIAAVVVNVGCCPSSGCTPLNDILSMYESEITYSLDPKMYIGVQSRSAARSAVVTRKAPAVPARRHIEHIHSVNGEAISRELSTSSTVIGPFEYFSASG